MDSKDYREFEINIMQLDNSRHEFNFELDTAFFQSFPESLIENGKGKAFLAIEKSETMMQFDFEIKLRVELVCDVSLEKFDHPIDLKKEIIFKFGDEYKELSEDLRVIPGSTASINVAEFIYEFANLAIPMKKIHPKLAEEDRPDLAYSDEVEDSGEEEIDPRWEVLKKLKK